MRILVVEDEPLLAGAVAEWLRGDAHAVDVVHDGGAALERIDVNEYDVVVLDRDLPVVHGDDVCRAVVESGAGTRVLMLTAAVDVADRVAGLELDSGRHTVTRDGRPLALSRKEFAVLEELLRADGAVVSAEQLLERAWDEHIDPFTNVLRVTVMTLRRKLGDPQVVLTVAGVGYQIR